MSTQTITNDNFKDTIDKEGIVLLDFWAEWCGPRKRFSPVYEQVSEEYPDHVFGKIDTEANQELAAGLQIQSIPTLMAFRDGILVYRDAGALPPKALKDLITQVEGLDMDEVRQKVAEQQSQEG
ncbi:MAG: thioredoxin domain-containing protein [Corynebacterium variabile]|nr:thioredoxin domain-containing protein [Corynebacterium variabile]